MERAHEESQNFLQQVLHKLTEFNQFLQGQVQRRLEWDQEGERLLYPDQLRYTVKFLQRMFDTHRVDYEGLRNKLNAEFAYRDMNYVVGDSLPQIAKSIRIQDKLSEGKRQREWNEQYQRNLEAFARELNSDGSRLEKVKNELKKREYFFSQMKKRNFQVNHVFLFMRDSSSDGSCHSLSVHQSPEKSRRSNKSPKSDGSNKSSITKDEAEIDAIQKQITKGQHKRAYLLWMLQGEEPYKELIDSSATYVERFREIDNEVKNVLKNERLKTEYKERHLQKLQLQLYYERDQQEKLRQEEIKRKKEVQQSQRQRELQIHLLKVRQTEEQTKRIQESIKQIEEQTKRIQEQTKRIQEQTKQKQIEAEMWQKKAEVEAEEMRKPRLFDALTAKKNRLAKWVEDIKDQLSSLQNNEETRSERERLIKELKENQSQLTNVEDQIISMWR